MIIQRRAFLTGLVASALAAPAIVKAAWIMPVKKLIPPPEFRFYSNLYEREFTIAEWAEVVDARLSVALVRYG